jgi:diguanylate cyclase (GGDEF)-like protein
MADRTRTANGDHPDPTRNGAARPRIAVQSDTVDLRDPLSTEGLGAASDRRSAAIDRAAAAVDRQQAALDRNRAAEYLRRTYRDELTGVLQREVGRDRVIEEIDRAHRTHADLTLAFLDVLGLKRINDECGHAAGDHLLKMAGHALRQGLRSYDVVVRYGGDEFVCALPTTSRGEARRRLAEVNETLRSLHPGGELSVGLAVLREGDTVEALMGRADRDLYASRRQSQDAVRPA